MKPIREWKWDFLVIGGLFLLPITFLGRGLYLPLEGAINLLLDAVWLSLCMIVAIVGVSMIAVAIVEIELPED